MNNDNLLAQQFGATKVAAIQIAGAVGFAAGILLAIIKGKGFWNSVGWYFIGNIFVTALLSAVVMVAVKNDPTPNTQQEQIQP